MKGAIEKKDKEEVSVVNHLLEVCNERISGYAKAAQEVKDQELKNIFTELSEQTEGFLRQLLQYINDSRARHQQTSKASKVWELWMELKSAITHGSRTAMLNMCITGEKAAIASFENALNKNLPIDLKVIVTAQLEQIKNSYRNIIAIKESISK